MTSTGSGQSAKVEPARWLELHSWRGWTTPGSKVWILTGLQEVGACLDAAGKTEGTDKAVATPAPIKPRRPHSRSLDKCGNRSIVRSYRDRSSRSATKQLLDRVTLEGPRIRLTPNCSWPWHQPWHQAARILLPTSSGEISFPNCPQSWMEDCLLGPRFHAQLAMLGEAS